MAKSAPATKKKKKSTEERRPSITIGSLVGKLVTVHIDMEGVKGGKMRLKHVDFNVGILTFTTKTRTLMVPIDKMVVELLG